MKQLWYVEENKIELLDVPIPDVGYGQVKIKVAYTAICATDIHMVTMGVLGAKPPMALGHETSGVIVEMGEGTAGSKLKVGDKVVANPTSACGICSECRSGHSQYCLQAVPTGAFAEYIVASAHTVYKVPDNADLRHYALVEPTVCTIRAMDLAQVRHGDTVLLSGAGGIGSILLNMIILSGAAKITVSEPVASKRENALAMGAQYTIDPFTEDFVERAMEITGGNGFDHIFEASGAPQAAQPCARAIARSGKITYFAVFPPKFDFPVNLYELYMREASIQTVFTNPDIFPRAINLIPRMQMDKIIGKILPLDHALEAIELFNQSIYPKILLEC